MKMELKGLCCFMLFITINLCDASRLLTQFNSTPPVKSIQSYDGDTIDCIDFFHQPAFDHPLLKDNSIPMKPSYEPDGASGKNNLYNSNGVDKIITQTWQLNGNCPEGTIPIRRTTQEELSRSSSFNRFVRKNYESNLHTASADPNITSQVFYQYAAVSQRGADYYGGKAILNIWEPKVDQPNEYSSSQLWIVGGSFDSTLNSIIAGWHVNPRLYGDNNSRFFIDWTSDNFQSTGCHNLLCSGFVQTSNEVALGVTLFPVSHVNTSLQFEISLLIWKDQKQNVWWLKYGDTLLGYWPASLFSNLANKSWLIEWGGLVSGTDVAQQTSTEMGSGHFPEEGFRRASYMKNLQVVDEAMALRALDAPRTLASKPNCYNITIGKANGWGDFFFYGGPGRNPNCP